MEDLGIERVHGRRVRLFQLSRWEWEEPRARPFVLFVGARAPDDETTRLEVRRFAAAAIDGGCGYVCAWGEGCELVHDLFDDVAIGADRFVISTWHDDEPLSSALYFALTLATPDEDEFPDYGNAEIVLAVEPPWVAEVRRLVADQDELASLWMADGK